MAGLVYLVMLKQLIILAESTHTPTIPSSFNFSTLGVLAANGSSAVGGCSNVTQNINGISTCNDPSSSVLFDGNIPTLAALDGDTWARQLMILYTPEFLGYTSYSFSIYPGFTILSSRRVEVTIFNCPQWGTGVYYITIYTTRQYSTYRIGRVYPAVLSCTSLLRICISFPTTNSTGFRLEFNRYSRVQYVHIAEIAFYSSGTPCPLFTTIPGTWTPSPPPDIQNTTTTKQPTDDTENQSSRAPTKSPNSEQYSTNATIQPQSTLLVAEDGVEGEMFEKSFVIIVAFMTLQTTVIFAVVIVIACRRKGTGSAPRRETTSHGIVEMENQVYETLDAGINTHGRRGTVQFKMDEAYAIPK